MVHPNEINSDSFALSSNAGYRWRSLPTASHTNLYPFKEFITQIVIKQLICLTADCRLMKYTPETRFLKETGFLSIWVSQ